MKLLTFTSGLVAVFVVALAGCADGPGANGESEAVACCGPAPYSSENMVTGTMGEPVSVTWSTGTGLVTLHQVKWEVVPLGKEVGTRLTFEATFEATSGTVKYGSRSWLENDSIGRDNGVQGPLVDGSLRGLPDAAKLQAGQKDRGWAAILIAEAPVAPVEINLVDFETRTKFVRWVIDPPPQPVLDAMTSTAPFTPASGRRLDCPGEVQGESFDAPNDFVAQSSPIEAAKRFAGAGMISGFVVPPGAVWTLAGTDDTGVFVATDGVLMHAVQSPTNGTWIIDEAQRCMP